MNILIAEDDLRSRVSIADFLRELGHKVTECDDGGSAFKAFGEGMFNVVLTDVRMPGVSGIELLRKIKSSGERSDTAVILFTAHNETQTIIEALRLGAYDYILKPINLEELVQVIERAAEHQALKIENEILTKKFDDAVRTATDEAREELMRLKKICHGIAKTSDIGFFSEKSRQNFEYASKLHENRSLPVLIEGETGTGKEVMARFVHFGPEADITSPFIDINCAAVTPNLFESELFGYESGAFTGGLSRGQKGKFDIAAGGTLFLDEVAEMPLDMQAKLLRVLQEKEFYRVGGLKKVKTDVRLICATNLDIEKQVNEGKFRRDLFFRLNVGRIKLLPLREKADEIVPLARLFLADSSARQKKRFAGISQDAEKILTRYDWPGNIRELKNIIEHIVFMYDSDKIEREHLETIIGRTQTGSIAVPSVPSGQPSADDRRVINTDEFLLPESGLLIDEYNNKIIARALEMHRGNKTETAKYLGITRRSLYCRLKNIMKT